MKRALLQNIKVQPYASGEVIDRAGFLSAVVGAKASAAGTLTLTITHSDDGTTFEPVTDKLVWPEKATDGGVYAVDVAANDIANIDIDLVGCKQYIKIASSGASATLAISLGDSNIQPA